MSYSKLFGSIIHSSIWQEPDHVRIVWITMLAMKDRDGVVEASIPGLARAAGKTIPETEAALTVLLAPDPYSRTPDNEGRRVEPIAGGWRVLNHDLYRDKLDQDERREKAARRVAKHREKKKQREENRASTGSVTPDVTLGNAGNAPKRSVTLGDAPKRHADADADLIGRVPPASGSGSGSSQPSDPDLGGGADRAQGRPAPERVRGPLPRPPAVPLVTAPDDARVRQGLVDRFRVAIGEARRAVAAKHFLTGVRFEIPLHGGENETELRQRLRESDDPAGDLEHVIGVAVAEAMAQGSVDWLGWNLGRSRSWDRAMRTTATKQQSKSVFDVVDQAAADLDAGKKIV